MSARRQRPADGPLLAWGDTLRAAKLKQARLYRRIAVGSVLVGILLGSAAMPPRRRLVWNATASAPIGLYWVSLEAPVAPGDIVVAWVPVPFQMLAARRHYLPLHVPLVKRVGATAGDEICAVGADIFINGRLAAVRQLRDGRARALPSWSGCRRLRTRQLFLLADNPASFDGRYFGVTESSDVIGKARLLWRR
jgi:conjugative transfer signal peptidase TraF